MSYKKMPKAQFTKADSLIRNICANYDNPTGMCLPLDTKCPQMIADSVICKYFRDVLLEDKEGQLLKAQIFSDENVKKCEVCGKAFQALSNRAKYCARCAEKVRRKKLREYKEKQRSNVII